MADILVLGSTGVIGAWLTRKLADRGHQVFGADLGHAVGEIGYAQRMTNTRHTYSRCDISEYRQLARIFQGKKFDYVYNCAAEFGRWNGEDFYEQAWKTNVIGLKHIIELQQLNEFKLVHFSSSEVYGDYKDLMYESVMDEFEIKQLNDYALTKWTNEQQIKNSVEMYGLETVVVRIFNTYGPGEYYHPYRSVNSKFCYNLLSGETIDVYTGHTRTSTYLEDTVTTIANISDNFIAGETYNIGGADHHSIEDLVKIITDKVEVKECQVNFIDQTEKMTTLNKFVDISKSVRDLGHTNTVSLEEGVGATIDWMRSVYGF